MSIISDSTEQNNTGAEVPAIAARLETLGKHSNGLSLPPDADARIRERLRMAVTLSAARRSRPLPPSWFAVLTATVALLILVGGYLAWRSRSAQAASSAATVLFPWASSDDRCH